MLTVSSNTSATYLSKPPQPVGPAQAAGSSRAVFSIAISAETGVPKVETQSAVERFEDRLRDAISQPSSGPAQYGSAVDTEEIKEAVRSIVDKIRDALEEFLEEDNASAKAELTALLNGRRESIVPFAEAISRRRQAIASLQDIVPGTVGPSIDASLSPTQRGTAAEVRAIIKELEVQIQMFETRMRDAAISDLF